LIKRLTWKKYGSLGQIHKLPGKLVFIKITIFFLQDIDMIKIDQTQYRATKNSIKL
jgi:hypothetical protein